MFKELTFEEIMVPSRFTKKNCQNKKHISVLYKLLSTFRYKKRMQKKIIVYLSLSFILIMIQYSCNIRYQLWPDGLYNYMDMSGIAWILENTHIYVTCETVFLLVW
jgi:hypothetical protein